MMKLELSMLISASFIRPEITFHSPSTVFLGRFVLAFPHVNLTNGFRGNF